MDPRLPFVLAAALLTACATAPAPAPSAPVAAASPEQVERTVHDEANRARGAERARPLAVHLGLVTAAREHAEELARRGELDHESTAAARRTVSMRVQLAGVTDYSTVGENLSAILGPQPDPGRQVVQLWLGSPGHRANLLEVAFDHAGVGAARARDGTWYVVQVYAALSARRSDPR